MPPAANSMMPPRIASWSTSQKPTDDAAYWPEQREDDHQGEHLRRADVGSRKFAPGIEALRQVLQTDQHSEQYGAARVRSEDAAESEGLRQEVGAHGDELRHRIV